MKIACNPMPERRISRFRSTRLLLQRRRRLQRRFALLLAAFIGLGSLLVATE